MILTKFKSFAVIAFTLLFATIFYDKLIGVNLLIFEVLLFLTAYYVHKPRFRTTLFKAIALGTFITLIAVIIHNSMIAKTVNILSFIALIGAMTFEEYRLLNNYFLQALHNVHNGINRFYKSLSSEDGMKIRLLHNLKIVIFPMVIIIAFLIIYYNSNDYFASLTDDVMSSINDLITWLPSMNWELFFLLILGFIITAAALFGKRIDRLVSLEDSLSNTMVRKKSNQIFTKMMKLKYEYKSGVFLLLILNLMLLVFNYSDITKIWFSFEWDGGYLKDFVHKGTYYLIVSLILSIVIVLYYFRGNLNFYSKNKFLKTLTFLWLGQNLILVISLFIRNSIYIQNFALAYKRIGVYAFLIAVCVGIVTIVLKVRDRRSLFYIIRINTLSVYFIFVTLTVINWDVVIAKYNILSFKESFIEMEFLLKLSDKALPYLLMSDDKLKEMEVVQMSMFSFRSSYISNQTFNEYLEHRIQHFIANYESREFLEWNYADYQAYRQLKTVMQ